MSEFQDVCADWLQGCTSPGKTLFTRGPGLLPCLKADFVSDFNPLLFLCSKVGFCRSWLPRNTGQVWYAGARDWLTNTCVTTGSVQWQWVCSPVSVVSLPSMTEFLQGAFSFLGSLGEVQGRAVHYWLEKAQGGQRVLPLAAGWAPVVCPKLCCHLGGWHEFLRLCWALLLPPSHKVCRLHNWALFMRFRINASIPPSTFFASYWKKVLN